MQIECDNHCRRSVVSLLPSMAAAALMLVLSGCSGFAGFGGQPVAEQSDLYVGQPEAVYGTEYPIVSAADARERASAALARGDVDRGLYMLVEAIKREPNDDVSLSTIGSIHQRRGNSALAAQAYTMAIEANPDNAGALEGLGVLKFEARETDAASELLERVIVLAPDRWRAHNVLGVIADTHADYEAASAHYDRALELQPGNVAILNNRGYSKYMSADYAAAKSDFLAVLERDPEHAKAWQNLGLVHARAHDYDEARDAMAHAVERHVAANDVGYVAMLDGDLDAAEFLFTEAIRLSPRYYKTAADNLAELRRRRGASSVLAIER